MTGIPKSRKAITLAVAGTLVALAAIGTAGHARSTDIAGLVAPSACAVLATQSGNSLALEAVFEAHGPVQGAYSFSVKSSGAGGSTNINQGGGFSAREAGTVSLGKVTVNAGGQLSIGLTVEANGVTHACDGLSGPRA